MIEQPDMLQVMLVMKLDIEIEREAMPMLMSNLMESKGNDFLKDFLKKII